MKYNIYILYYIIIQKSLRCGVIWCHLFSCLPALRSSSLEAPDVKPRREHKIYNIQSKNLKNWSDLIST